VDVDGAAPPRRQERLELGRVRHLARDVDLARHGCRAGVVLLEEAAEHLLVGRLAGRVEEVHVAADHLAVAEDEQHHGGLVVVAGQADHVELGPGEGGHLLALHRPLDGPDLVAVLGRPLEVEALGRPRPSPCAAP
jgi:hypothetical protein